MIAAQAKYSIGFIRSRRKFSLSLNFILFVNVTKMHQFKEKDSKANPYPFSLGNISKDFTVNNMVKKILNGYVYNFSVHYNSLDISGVINIQKYLMKKHI